MQVGANVISDFLVDGRSDNMIYRIKSFMLFIVYSFLYAGISILIYSIFSDILGVHVHQTAPNIKFRPFLNSKFRSLKIIIKIYICIYRCDFAFCSLYFEQLPIPMPDLTIVYFLTATLELSLWVIYDPKVRFLQHELSEKVEEKKNRKVSKSIIMRVLCEKRAKSVCWYAITFLIKLKK